MNLHMRFVQTVFRAIYGGEAWYIAAEKAGVDPILWLFQDLYTWMCEDVFGPWM